MRSLLWAHSSTASFLWDLSPSSHNFLKLQFASPASDIAPSSWLLLLSVWHPYVMLGINKYPEMKNQQQIQGSPQCVSLDSSTIAFLGCSKMASKRFVFLVLAGVLVWYIVARSIYLWSIIFLLFLFGNLYNESPQMLMFESLTKQYSSGNQIWTR